MNINGTADCADAADEDWMDPVIGRMIPDTIAVSTEMSAED